MDESFINSSINIVNKRFKCLTSLRPEWNMKLVPTLRVRRKMILFKNLHIQTYHNVSVQRVLLKVIILKEIYFDSCGISFRGYEEAFIVTILKLGQLLMDILLEKHESTHNQQSICCQILHLFNYLCDGSNPIVTFDQRFSKMLSEIFIRFGGSTKIDHIASYNLHMLLKLMKKSQDILAFHNESCSPLCLLPLLSQFVMRCTLNISPDHHRKSLALLKKFIIFHLSYLSSIDNQERFRLLTVIDEAVQSLSPLESVEHAWVSLFLHDDSKLVQLLAHFHLLEEDPCQSHNRAYLLMRPLLESIFYDVDLICVWLQTYEDFAEVFASFLRTVDNTDQLAEFLGQIWCQMSDNCTNELRATLQRFQRHIL